MENGKFRQHNIYMYMYIPVLLIHNWTYMYTGYVLIIMAHIEFVMIIVFKLRDKKWLEPVL